MTFNMQHLAQFMVVESCPSSWANKTLQYAGLDRINRIFSMKSDFFDEIDLFDFFNILDNHKK